MGTRADNWDLVAKIAEMVIDTAESVEGLQRIMAEGPFAPLAMALPPGKDPYALPAGNAEAMAMLKHYRPDLVPALRTRFTLRKAHLYAVGKAKADPIPCDEPAPAPANAIRRRA